MWLFSDGIDDPQDDTVMKKHSTNALYSAVNNMMDAIRTEAHNAQQDAAHRIIQIQYQE